MVGCQCGDFFFFFSLSLALSSWMMPITFLLSAQWAALSLRTASVSSLLKPQAPNHPRFTMRNQTFFVSGKQSAVLCRIWPTMRFLCALPYTSARAHIHKRHPPLLSYVVEDNLALEEMYFWILNWWRWNNSIFLQWQTHASSQTSDPMSGVIFFSSVHIVVLFFWFW